MGAQILDPVQIRKIGLKALAEALGPVGMVRFLHFFETGVGDYTREKKKWLGEPSVHEIVEEIKEKRKGK